MDTTDIRQQAAKFKKSRSNLLIVVVFTSINLLLTAFKAGVYLLFSATVPQLAFSLGSALAEETQNNAVLVVGLIAAVAVIMLYLVCWVLSNRYRSFMLVALILFIADCLVFAFLAVFAEFEVSYLLDIAFHVWILVYLINGVRSWAKLRGVSAEDFAVALQPPVTVPPLSGDVPQNIGSEGGYVNTDTAFQVRHDDKDGKILISAEYKGLQISMKRSRGLTELIVNGYVHAEIAGTFESKYTLSATVQNARIEGKYNSSFLRVYLYADGNLIAKKLRIV
ncbi:MAG: hypothetical protein LBN02_00915 [Oscillospiraceae bacterium]|jgi:Ca2+/Na+ antiporter|nr:hypothetical protein [Oscillospiraceae bacterium]